MRNCLRRSRRIDLRLTTAAAAVLLIAPWTALSAQGPVKRADDLLRSGRVFAAESLYYAAVSLTPRDPVARHALGRYLAARGRLKIGATLMEEARFFGGDSRVAAEALAPVYEAMHEYRALAALPATPLGAAERQRVIWLRDNPPGMEGSDSAVVRLSPASGSALGTIPVTIAGEQAMATIDPTVRGIVMDTTWRRWEGIKRFPVGGGTEPHRIPAVAQQVEIGTLKLRNVPARFGRERGVTIGLDVLGALTPTFDPAAEMLIVRRARRLPRGRGELLPTVVQRDGWFVSDGERLLPIQGAEARALLDGRRWTVHAWRGVLVLER
jgi:hypothetical protein